MPNYVKIPREIIYDTSLSDKRVIIFSYLCARRSLDDTVAFSTKELCDWSKMKPNYRAGKINQKYYEVLLLLSRYGYFNECPDFEKCLTEGSNSDKFRKVKLNIKKFDIPDGFGIIYFDELEKIINFKEELKNIEIDTSRISSAHILLILAYIRVNLNRDSSKPLCCYRHYKRINEDTGVSDRYVSKSLEILKALKIINYAAMQRIRHEDKHGSVSFSTTPKIFADYRHFTKDSNWNQIIDSEYDSEVEIQKQIERMKNI